MNPEAKKHYREVKNYIHNDIKITRDDIRDILKAVVHEELRNYHGLHTIYEEAHLEMRRIINEENAGIRQETANKTLYRIRKSWDDSKSQIGAYTNLESAKSVCKSGYYVFDEKGNKVYPLEDMKNSTSNISVELRMLRSGMGGKDVEAMQAILIAKGYSCGTYGSDGDFGENTEKAVRNFQTDRKLSADGIVGEKTWAELFR